MSFMIKVNMIDTSSLMEQFGIYLDKDYYVFFVSDKGKESLKIGDTVICTNFNLTENVTKDTIPVIAFNVIEKPVTIKEINSEFVSEAEFKVHDLTKLSQNFNVDISPIGKKSRKECSQGFLLDDLSKFNID